MVVQAQRAVLAASSISLGALWLLTAHCGSDPDVAPNNNPQNNDASSGDALATSDSPNNNDSSSTSVDASSEADSPAEPNLHQCAAIDTFKAIGTINGTAINEAWDPTGLAYVPGDPWFIFNAFRTGGYEYIRGVGQGSPPELGAGSHSYDIAFALAPPSSKYAKQTICLGSGSAVYADDTITLRGARAKLLGACPGGTPAAGELELCSNGSLNCPSTISGTLTGATFDGAEINISGSSADDTVFAVNILGPHFFLSGINTTTPEPASGAILPIEGIFASLPKPGSAGAIYCMGAGSVVEWVGPNGTRVTIKNATKLGDCGGTDLGGDQPLVFCR